MNGTRGRGVYSLFEQAVERAPEGTALVDLESGERVTYSALRERVRRAANGLAERGVGRGDRVAVCLRNRPEHVALFLATQAIGAVEVPFNFRLARGGVRYTLADAEPSLLVYGPDVAEHVAAVHDSVPLDDYVALLDDDVPGFADPYEALVDAPAAALSVDVSPGDRSVIQYSSGTTGDPKGIEVTHEGSVARAMVDAFGQRFRMEEEVMLGVMPLYHTVGLHGILLTMLATSGTYVSAPRFEPKRCVRAIETEGVTAFHEAPTIFKRLLEADAIRDTDTDSVRVVTYSGAPMGETLYRRVVDAFDPEFVSNQYGCTEAYAPLAQFNLREGGRPTETGRANLLQRVRVVELESGDPGAAVERGVAGELVVHTEAPTTFDGYWRKPEATAASVRDGWFFTGDVARRVGDGRVVIEGRADDMIISGGENIAPSDVEDVLAAHGGVADVAVVGTPDEEWGEVPTAYVVRGEGAEVSPGDLDRWCLDSEDLPDFKRPRGYEFIAELPRNPSGKVLRYRLRGDGD